MATYDDFLKLDIRVGKITEVEDFPEARKPSYILTIDFGEGIGTKKSSVQVVKHHTKEELLNKEVVCVVNFAEKQIGPFVSQVLTLGLDDGTDDASNWIVLSPAKDVPLGRRVK